ncbi:hypothetical protein POVWA2_032290 [Plasmodium ovale wallikeri]|uniref:Uncharacterized protein n=1 Tax=Plasmodium ovale wallikeri TaxID=864142 RepID=A0A1A8YZC3_PLAOA|nr:hypothetical protein POVWA1_032660 [Plasmodium ovale wallikeri]SBT36877.1 hypothetical protein POVWA2_032290 [Plasmodium ovale wallikeri]
MDSVQIAKERSIRGVIQPTGWLKQNMQTRWGIDNTFVNGVPKSYQNLHYAVTPSGQIILRGKYTLRI